jgi:hypothetical protein
MLSLRAPCDAMSSVITATARLDAITELLFWQRSLRDKVGPERMARRFAKSPPAWETIVGPAQPTRFWPCKMMSAAATGIGPVLSESASLGIFIANVDNHKHLFVDNHKHLFKDRSQSAAGHCAHAATTAGAVLSHIRPIRWPPRVEFCPANSPCSNPPGGVAPTTDIRRSR